MLAATVGGVGLATALPVLICLAVAGSRDGSAPPEAEHAVAPVRLWASIMVVGVWCAIYVLLLLWQEVTIKIDRVNARLMFPAYAGGLLIGLLLLEATCRLLPEQLRRLRLLTCVVILPLLLLPGARVFKQQHAQPTPLEDWVRRNTAEDALLVGRNIWGIRYATGRTVLTSQYGRDKSAALDGAALSVFLDRHGDRFDGVYLIVSAGEYAAAKESLRAAGMDADTVYRADVLGGSAVRVLQIAARGSP